MGSVTWGVNGEGRASVFCSLCREVFKTDVSVSDARELTDLLKRDHVCRGKDLGGNWEIIDNNC